MKSTTRIVAALAAIALLAGCQSSTESTASEGTTQLAEAGALPVTVDHAYGSTTIETEPQRIVTIGWNSQDSVLALGKTPVAMESFSGAGLENGILPWDENCWAMSNPRCSTARPVCRSSRSWRWSRT
ncbi:hypothetical protein ACQGAO_01395 [Rhodococcus sp. 1.20]